MRVELEIWRQDGPRAQGFFESHVVEDAEPQMSLLELLDRLNLGRGKNRFHSFGRGKTTSPGKKLQ